MTGIEPRHLDFSGRRVLVTGAAGGLGSRVASGFHAHGARVVCSPLADYVVGDILIADGGYILT